MDLITSLTSQATHKALDGLAKRHKAIASNLANVDTPNYKRRDVSFEGALEQAIQSNKNKSLPKVRPTSNDEPMTMRATRAEHFGIGNVPVSIEEIHPESIESEGVQFRNDGNAVDVETEMSQLAKNTQKYLALSNIESRSIRSLRSVISGGGS